MVAIFQERIFSLPALAPNQQNSIDKVLKNPELDAKHKLKVVIPIIPFVLEYEGELELGTGFDLKSAWKKLITKFREINE
ncbi:hypothetical protein [Spirulina sp. 06S082]|uniref:hypothetical protein n=1 Tax=Spirulina sp. 06S082 TaxID=3110248 RepID=UPI002B1FC96F|nr:hypothetical protein [Spirulina sp. 06S082]MEA5470353.1 hypothetical protein [Spirulina sp. 06S082]